MVLPKIRTLGNVRQIIYGVQPTMHYSSPLSTSILIIGLLLRNVTMLLVLHHQQTEERQVNAWSVGKDDGARSENHLLLKLCIHQWMITQLPGPRAK